MVFKETKYNYEVCVFNDAGVSCITIASTLRCSSKILRASG
ncbi:hypothetical protein SAMN02745131_03912 [Flavisolibacter ginsengisoli DSM 18119]|uniref:Uncharacterized protein n=1 Tax=Flavisolibacter ginsengisoli DSM 18119 TaxID=1121884 RepID=A0A1M5FRX0_9BACT|nr:hypothetical protein SAMN02745131_03912 [Flavisolibacter ginsengisoli DSM 18119]